MMFKRFQKATVTIMAALCMLSLLAGIFGCAKKTDIRDIVSFKFTYQTGNAMNADIRYGVTVDENGITASIKPDGADEDSTVTVAVSREFLDELESVLLRYDVGRWNGFNGNNKMVLDGKSFYMGLTTASGDSLEAHGYARFPSNFAEVRQELDRLFMALIQQ